MAATKQDISNWFDNGKVSGATHMIVVCDTWDWSDYPVYVQVGEDVYDIVAKKTGQNMQQLMEVYSFALDKESQMAERRACHYD